MDVEHSTALVYTRSLHFGSHYLLPQHYFVPAVVPILGPGFLGRGSVVRVLRHTLETSLDLLFDPSSYTRYYSADMVNIPQEGHRIESSGPAEGISFAIS